MFGTTQTIVGVLLLAVVTIASAFPFRDVHRQVSSIAERNESLPEIDRIMNGGNAYAEEVKKFVQLHISVRKKSWWIFYNYNEADRGATMYNKRLLITAAHCFVDVDNDGYSYYQGRSYARYGRNDYDQGSRTNFDKVYLHKGYVGRDTPYYDIALIKLKEDLNGYNGQPSFLESNSLTNLVTMGFGVTSQNDDTTPDRLQAASITSCTRRNRDTSIGANSQMIACYVGGSSSTRTCQGDSGGPLFSKEGSIPTVSLALFRVVRRAVARVASRILGLPTTTGFPGWFGWPRVTTSLITGRFRDELLVQG